jgi:uncharacterized membrane protein YdfJ with MMPL/SSD domain
MRQKLSTAALAVAGILAALAAALAVWRRPLRRAPGAEASGPEPADAAAAGVRPAGPVRPVDLEPHPTGAFAALGRFDYRFRRVLPVLGLALMIGLQVWSAQEGGRLIQGGWVIEGSEEQQAAALLADRFGQQASTIIFVFTDPDGDAAAPGFQARIAEAVEPITDDPLVAGVTTYADSPVDELLSEDGTKTLMIVTLTEDEEGAVEEASELAAEVEPPDGVEMLVTGIPQLYHEFNEQIERDLIRGELISLPIALLILLAVFGTIVGAILPILVVGIALPSTYAVVSLLAGVTDVSIFVMNLASMIGLALAIDYSLFMVSRFREEIEHHSVEIAVERMMGSVGKAVAVSGIAVAIGLSSLIVFEAEALRSMGIGGVITVVSTLLYGLTVLPAVLGMLGPRVNRLRVPLPRFLRLEDVPEEAEARRGRGMWAWIAARVMRRPILVATPVLGLLLLAGSPFLSLQLSTGQNLEDLPPTPAREAFFTIRDEFPGGESDPITVAVAYDQADLLADGIPLERQGELRTYLDELTSLDGVTRVESALDPPPGLPAEQYAALLAAPPEMRPPEVAAPLDAYLADWVSDDVMRLRVFSDRLPDSDAGRALVDDVRAVAPPPAAETLTGGLPSRSRDFMDSFYSSVPIAVLIVVAVTGGVLFLTFGSVFLPVKAVLMSLISVSASFGALVWIFQQGNLSGLLNIDPSGTTAAWLPIIMFAILFGLSMDYEVFLLSRIRERYLTHGDNTRAVAEGIGITGSIITGAALIMVAVFGAFALSSIVFLKALGFSMALAVLIDATIVRGILVPAFMRVMGSVNWWAPRWVQRIVARAGLYEGITVEPVRP